MTADQPEYASITPDQLAAVLAADPNVTTPEHARDVAHGFAESRDRIHRQIAAQVSSGDVTGLDGAIGAAQRYDTLARLWGTYAAHGPDDAARQAGRMLYRAVERSEVDAASLEAARNFLCDVHEMHQSHAEVLRHFTHGIA